MNIVPDSLRRDGRAIALRVGGLLLFPLASSGQLIDTLPPPPEKLPQLIFECETAPNYRACSLWVWRGSFYSAIWQNGAVGQMTVRDGNERRIQFERQDSAGPVAGLTATYTANWDGKAFSDGQAIATLKGGSNQLTWTGIRAVAPVFPSPELNYTYVNWYPAQLTAFAIFNSQGSFNFSVGTEINDYRIRGETPMSPGESRRFTQRYSMGPDKFEGGVTYPQASAMAAIYADGATFGDRGVLEAMLEKRKLMAAALVSIETTVCRLGQRGDRLQDISVALNQQHAAEDSRVASGKEERNSAYSEAQKILTGTTNRDLPLKEAVKRTFNQLDQLRSGLAADPVKDAAGNLVVPAASALSCGLS